MSDLILSVSTNLVLRGDEPELFRDLMGRLTFPNPRWAENDRFGRYQGDTQQNIRGYRQIPGGLSVPRGTIGQVIALCRKMNVRFRIDDRRRTLPEVPFHFRGTLKPFQREAVEAMLTRDLGTLAAPTGSGKTVMALAVIACRKQPTLILVHTRELLNQWISRIETFLGIPREEIGIIGSGKMSVGGRVTVGIVNSVYGVASRIREHIGFLVVDECHRTPSRTFTEAVSAFDCRYTMGLSATPWRRDGLSRLIFWHVGNVLHKVEEQVLLDSGDIIEASVTFRETKFETFRDPVEDYQGILSDLTTNPDRNALIVSDVLREAVNGSGTCLVLSDRKDHCHDLARRVAREGVIPAVLTGDMADGDRRAVVERLNSGNVRVLIATGQLIGEGFDCPSLSTLFLTTPIKFNGRLLQYLGRVMRPAPGKEKARVYDYVDAKVGVLKAAAMSRARTYGNRQHIAA